MVAGRVLSFWDGLFSGAVLASGVQLHNFYPLRKDSQTHHLTCNPAKRGHLSRKKVTCSKMFRDPSYCRQNGDCYWDLSGYFTIVHHTYRCCFFLPATWFNHIHGGGFWSQLLVGFGGEHMPTARARRVWICFTPNSCSLGTEMSWSLFLEHTLGGGFNIKLA